MKENEFNFDIHYLHFLYVIKEKLVTTPVIVAPNWELPFELMCDESDYVVGAVLSQQHVEFFHVIYYDCNVLNENKLNYTTIGNELLVVVFALEKFCSYLIGLKVVVCTYHATFNYLTKKQKNIVEEFPDEHKMAISERP